MSADGLNTNVQNVCKFALLHQRQN